MRNAPDPTLQSPAARLTPDGLPVGTPLAWPVVDLDGTPLFARGETLANDRERAFLFEHFAPCRGDAPAPAMADDTPPLPTGTNDMQLAVGASMGLRKQATSGARMLPCRLIGFAPDGALFVTSPSVDGQGVSLIAGENVEIVAVASQAVFRFVCTVGTVCLSPLEYIVLSPPAAIRCLRRRRSMRIQARFPVRCGAGESGSGYDGLALAKGVSPTGLSLAASWQLGEVGERVRVAFRLCSADLDVPVETAAIIRNVQPSPQDGSGSIAHGLELDRLTPSEQTAMKAYMFDRHEGLVYGAGATK